MIVECEFRWEEDMNLEGSNPSDTSTCKIVVINPAFHDLDDDFDMSSLNFSHSNQFGLLADGGHVPMTIVKEVPTNTVRKVWRRCIAPKHNYFRFKINKSTSAIRLLSSYSKGKTEKYSDSALYGLMVGRLEKDLQIDGLLDVLNPDQLMHVTAKFHNVKTAPKSLQTDAISSGLDYETAMLYEGGSRSELSRL